MGVGVAGLVREGAARSGGLALEHGVVDADDLELAHFAFFLLDRLLDDFEEALDGLVALDPAHELLLLEALQLAKVEADELAQAVLLHAVLVLVDLEDRDQAAGEHELELADVDDVALVQVEHFEQELDFGLDFGLAVQNHRRENLEGVDESLVLGVPNRERGLVDREYLLVLGQRNREIVADALERAVVFLDLVQGFLGLLGGRSGAGLLPKSGDIRGSVSIDSRIFKLFPIKRDFIKFKAEI